jgi:hypothetical protein
MATRDLTEREQRVLDHLQQAQALGVSLREYAGAYGLDVKELYNGKAQLMRKGVLAESASRSNKFLPVEIAPSAVTEREGCRIVHSSGWTIECTSLPDAAWIAALVQPLSDA